MRVNLRIISFCSLINFLFTRRYRAYSLCSWRIDARGNFVFQSANSKRKCIALYARARKILRACKLFTLRQRHIPSLGALVFFLFFILVYIYVYLHNIFTSEAQPTTALSILLKTLFKELLTPFAAHDSCRHLSSRPASQLLRKLIRVYSFILRKFKPR